MVDLEKNILENLEKNEKNMIQLRRYFHQNPEISAEEYNTQKKILEELKSYGIDAKSMSKTGVIADIKGSGNGKTIAIRADIDALPLPDEITTEYKSKNNGVCHACGHDCHTASLLGIAKAFSENKNFNGTIRLLFQPSEEKTTGFGALGMIKEGALNGVDNIIGYHVWQPVEVGKIGITKYMMASAAFFEIKITGKGGHGSQPQLCINPINIGAQIVLALNTITSCKIDPREMAVLSCGAIESGLAHNVIPETCTIKGSTRCYSNDIMATIEAEIRKITKGICEYNGAKFEVDFNVSTAATICDDKCLEITKEVIKKQIGNENLIDIKSNLGAEDFSYFLEKCPGVFMFVGGNDGTEKTKYGHHNPKFDVNEKAILNGAKILSSLAIELLNK